MKYQKLALVAAITAAVTGCGGSSSSSKFFATQDFVSCDNTQTPAVCTLSGVIDEDYTLTADKSWRLDGTVLVGSNNVELLTTAAVAEAKANGVTLTIEPGVHVRAFGTGELIVTRGNKIMAEGTAAQPITFSSFADNDFDGEGEWGGVVVQGFAPQYGAGDTGICVDAGICNVAGEGGDAIGYFGGADASDNSGVMKYVRIAEGGKVAGPNNEVNGLTLMGVGHGTTLEYIQVHGNLDDGIEWFGGTVNLKYAVLTNNDDDDLDYDEGYKGNMQHVFIRKHPTKTGPTGTNDPRGIEGNSDLAKGDQVSATNAAIANVTIIGSAVSAGQPGMKLRGSLTTDLYNIAVSNFAAGCLEVKDSELVDVSVASVICDTTEYKNDDPQSGSIVLTAATIDFDAAAAVTNAEAATGETVMTAVDNGSGFSFDATGYIGAVDPDNTNATRKWWDGWVIPGSMDGL
ncbi:MAG TPA: hypothetical protein VIN71_06920 [Pseudomonadales bacterium]